MYEYKYHTWDPNIKTKCSVILFTKEFNIYIDLLKFKVLKNYREIKKFG